MKLILTSVLSGLLLVCTASADLVVTLTGSEPEGGAVKISKPVKGQSSSTSVRFKTNKAEGETDRDFGQTFTTGNEGYYLDRITLKLGTQPIAPSVFGAHVSVQLFEVSGTAVLNDNGTKTGKVADWCDDPRVDDFMDGETYASVGIARSGRMPAYLRAGQFVVLNFRAAERVKLKPKTQYGFLFMFDESAPDRAVAFATNYWSDYAGGHAIRRDGEIAADMEQRGAKQPTTKAGTKSDVYSDAIFWVEGSDTPSESPTAGVDSADQSAATASTTQAAGRLPLPKK